MYYVLWCLMFTGGGGGLKLTMWRNSPQPRASSRRSLVPVGTVNPQSPFGPSPSFFLSCCVYDEAIMPVFLKSRTFARIEKCTKNKTCSVVIKNFRIVVVSVHDITTLETVGARITLRIRTNRRCFILSSWTIWMKWYKGIPSHGYRCVLLLV